MGDYYGDMQDAAYEQWQEEQWFEDLYNEHIAEFTSERLQSFYVENPLIADASLRALREARELFAQGHYSAALVFAFVAAEVGIKSVLFKPIVYGLVLSDPVAEMVSSFMVKQSINRFRGLLFQVLLDYGGVDLGTFIRVDSNRTLWEEFNALRNHRNVIIHRADVASEEEAEQAILIASCVLEQIFPAVIREIGLHLQNNNRVLRTLEQR